MMRLKRVAVLATLALASLVVSFIGMEIGLRLFYLPNPWTTQNFTVDPVNQQISNVAIQYDPLLGYIPRARYGFTPSGGPYSHGEMGVRLNVPLPPSSPAPPLPTDGILAVGDSFTYGSDVGNSESWPAQLEANLGVPVVNGGAGGYGIDQAVLRAEQLLNTVKPRVVIVSFIPNCVGRNEYIVHSGGLVKPYFDVINGALELRNVPIPAYQPSVKHVGRVRAVLGHSYTLYWVLDRFGLRDRWLIFQAENRVVHTKGVEVSCLLWNRLAERTAGRNIRLIALAQYAGIQVSGEDDSRKHFEVERVLACAREAGFLVVDSYPVLRRAFETDPSSFWPFWVKQPNDKVRHTGHMSEAGNHLTAELLSRTIRAQFPELALDKR